MFKSCLSIKKIVKSTSFKLERISQTLKEVIVLPEPVECQTYPDFKSNIMVVGYHGYINIVITGSAIPVSVAIQKNTKDKPVISIYPSNYKPLYLGKFIVPKGAIYCVNELNEIISNEMIYTGQYSSVWKVLDTNLKEYFKSI